MSGLGSSARRGFRPESVLNATLSRLVTAAHERESEGVMLSNEHLSGIGDRPGDKLTVVVPSHTDEGARMRAESGTNAPSKPRRSARGSSAALGTAMAGEAIWESGGGAVGVLGSPPPR